MLGAIEIRQGMEGFQLAFLGPLAVRNVQHGQTVIQVGDRGGDATVQATAGENDGQGFVRGRLSVVHIRNLETATDSKSETRLDSQLQLRTSKCRLSLVCFPFLLLCLPAYCLLFFRLPARLVPR